MDKNHKNELFTKIALGAVIILSEISIIFIIRSLDFTNVISIFFSIFTLNLAFVIFGIRQQQTQKNMFEIHKKAEDSKNKILTIVNN